MPPNVPSAPFCWPFTGVQFKLPTSPHVWRTEVRDSIQDRFDFPMARYRARLIGEDVPQRARCGNPNDHTQKGNTPLFIINDLQGVLHGGPRQGSNRHFLHHLHATPEFGIVKSHCYSATANVAARLSKPENSRIEFLRTTVIGHLG